jgi:hypothetical protein
MVSKRLENSAERSIGLYYHDYWTIFSVYYLGFQALYLYWYTYDESSDNFKANNNHYRYNQSSDNSQVDFLVVMVTEVKIQGLETKIIDRTNFTT